MIIIHTGIEITLRWRHNGRDSVSNHQPQDCLLNRLFRPRSKKISKLRVTGLCAGNSPVTGEFPAQRASNAENVSVWWRHHESYHDNTQGSLNEMKSHNGLLGMSLSGLSLNDVGGRSEGYFKWPVTVSSQLCVGKSCHNEMKHDRSSPRIICRQNLQTNHIS